MSSPTLISTTRELLEALHAKGLKIRRDRTYYAPHSGVRRWTARSDSAYVALEHWSRHRLPEGAWRLTARGPGGNVTLEYELNFDRLVRLLTAIEVLG